MTDRALRIVVLDGRGDRHASEVTAAIAEALESERTSEAADGRGAEIGSGDPAYRPDALLHDADAAVVLDDGSLVRAREAGAPVCVAVLPGLDASWPGDLGEADCVLVAHESSIDAAVRRGASRADVAVVGPVPPRGYAPPTDRAALRKELGIEHAGPLVLVPSQVLEEEGTDAVLIQLALVSKDIGYLFFVDDDAEAAEQLRRLVPVHGLGAWMFAEERGAERFWQLADVVLGRARGYEVSRALAVGAPVVLLPPGRSDAATVRAIDSAGVGRDADVLATLSVTIEAALEPAALAEARDAIAALQLSSTRDRLAEAVRDAWKRVSAGGAALSPRGLPHGLEKLAAAPAPAPRHSSMPPSDDDLEARIERELAELKKRI